MKFRSILLAAAALCAGLVAAVPAFAYPAQATTALNVRSGPSTGYGVVDVLYQGETVNVTSCSGGWCTITHDGPDGYVSGRYLTNSQPTPPPSSPPPVYSEPAQPQTPQVGFCIDAPNFRFGVNCNDNQPAPTPAQVCFYENVNYGGASFCAEPGDRYSTLNWFNDRISSIRISGVASAVVCEDWYYRGRCARVSNSLRRLGPANNDIISSIRVD